MEMYQDNEKDALENIKKSDYSRSSYYRNISGKKWGDYKNYHGAVREKMYFSKIWERTADWLGGVNRNNYDSFWTLDNFLCW